MLYLPVGDGEHSFEGLELGYEDTKLGELGLGSDVIGVVYHGLNPEGLFVMKQSLDRLWEPSNLFHE